MRNWFKIRAATVFPRSGKNRVIGLQSKKQYHYSVTPAGISSADHCAQHGFSWYRLLVKWFILRAGADRAGEAGMAARPAGSRGGDWIVWSQVIILT